MAFYRLNKTRNYTVMSNYHLRDQRLSLKAIGLMSKMLSYSDGWNFSTAGLVSMCKEEESAIKSALRELEACGYLRRSRERDSKGRMGGTLFEIYEQPQEEEKDPQSENPQVENPQVENPPVDSDNICIYNNIHESKDERISKDIRSIRNTNKRNTKLIDRWDARAREQYEQVLRENLCMDIIEQDNQVDQDIAHELFDVALDTVCMGAETVRINRADIPHEVVKSRLLKLNDFHLRYVIDAIKTAPPVRNVRGYMLTALYNAPITMETYYTTQINGGTKT